MSNNTPDYNDNLYFDCTLGNNDLTSQWRKGELQDGEYWCLSICNDIDKLYCYQNSFWKYKTEDDYYGIPVEIKQVLAPVPSYDEWFKIKNLASLTSLLQEKNIECLHRENKLKELLKECELWFTGIVGNMNDKNVGEHNRNLPIGNFEHIFKVFSQKINEVLNAK